MRSLERFTVANFRAFDTPVSIALAPLTLVFGENNSGKSGLLRLLPFLADSFDPRITAALNMDSPALRGAGFADLLCKATKSQALELMLDWGDVSLAIHLRELADSIRPAWFKLEGTGDAFEGTWADGDGYDVQTRGRVQVPFQGLAPHAGKGFPPVVSQVSDRVGRLPKEVLWLEATREPVPREEPAPRAAPLGIGSRGEKAVAMCAWDDEVRRRVSAWYEEHFGLEFSVQRLAEHIRPVLRRTSSSYSIPLPDCGEGFSQVLPVVTAAALAGLKRGPRLLCLEHPELHLHPDAHPAIAALFCELTKADSARILVETHSENLLLEVLLAVADQRLSQDAVAIYWVRQRADGTSAAERVGLGPGARLGPEFPANVFRRDIELSRRLIRLRATADEV